MRTFSVWNAIVALEHLADAILFIFDASETCGFHLDNQYNLLKQIEKIFSDVPVIYLFNKMDLVEDAEYLNQYIDDEENFGKSAYLVNSILPLVNQFSDRCILELFEKRFSNMLIDNSNEFQDEEIEVNRRYQSRYRLHNNIVKKYLLTSKRKRKQEF